VISLGTGAGFSTFENICHILAYGAESISYVMIRGFAAGIMHIISVYALALAMIRLKRYNISYVYVIAGGLGLSMSFHALYNLLVSEAGITSYIGYALPVSAAAVLVLIVKRDRSYKGATE
ncbi:MAG: PrsW family intramembrane metalloprotease, partial [Lachnospiraceae bacterium]|nr:PrsW family intramembrane metalloprotease [Lachnospiraceae bacterium]